jgi:two-component system NtrC family sensor kinase
MHMNPEELKEIRLLLVDDEENFRTTLAKRLQKRGLATRQAAGGRDCLTTLAASPMDVVVMDVKMPEMNGIEVLHEIKRLYPETEVLFLTGHSTTQDGVEGIKLGAFDYLSKPIEFEHLLGKIQQAYEKKTRRQEKRQEAEYKERIKQQMMATERLAALGTLAAGVAHEINNPLAIINEAAGFMKVLFDKPEMADLPRKKDIEKALDKIRTGVTRARAITHQLLGSVSKHEAVLTEIDLAELAAETVQLVRKEADYKDIAISLEAAPGLNPIWIDPNQVRQVLINLLTNAIHATDKNGRIGIAVSTTGNDVCLAVSDTGKGIPKLNLDKIFDPFFSDKPPGQGTGLGLFVCREIVDKWGGRIDVTSKVGQGTTVRVLFPNQYKRSPE